MSTYCGVDFHARQQSVKWCDTADGEIRERGYSLSIKSAASQEEELGGHYRGRQFFESLGDQTFSNFTAQMERATGIETRITNLGIKSFDPLFEYLQNRPEKIYVHALHTVHALPDLCIAGGRLGDDFFSSRSGP